MNKLDIPKHLLAELFPERAYLRGGTLITSGGALVLLE